MPSRFGVLVICWDCARNTSERAMSTLAACLNTSASLLGSDIFVCRKKLALELGVKVRSTMPRNPSGSLSFWMGVGVPCSSVSAYLSYRPATANRRPLNCRNSS